MTIDLNTGILLGLLGVVIGCMQYVHVRTNNLYKLHAKFVQGWNEWRMDVVQRLTAIETALEIEKEAKK